ncbi:MAG: GLPGLI family protein, partial [Bacteroidia bacterium]|nr:GLPGLI family protein [Bacteroidia bacterium]
EYTCFKASYTYERDAMRTRTISNEKEEIQQPEKPEKETIEVVAWYTPQIPVKNGPGAYGGLPGLILEVNDGELTVLCNKVVLNPKNGLDIKEPKGGKVVSQEEYDKIMDKKMEEMEERFQSDGRRKGNGSEIEIRVRG